MIKLNIVYDRHLLSRVSELSFVSSYCAGFGWKVYGFVKCVDMLLFIPFVDGQVQVQKQLFFSLQNIYAEMMIFIIMRQLMSSCSSVLR